MWTVQMLLDMIQEAIGEPVGGFYNISTRLAHLTQAQNELVDETLAMMNSVSLEVTPGQYVYKLPDDFSRFGDRQPYVYDHAGSSSLEVTYSAKMDVEHPGWHLGRDHGTPLYIVQDGDNIILWPTPTRAWTLNFNYVPIPDELVEMDQVPFNGRPDLNRYAPALAYKVAFLLLLPRAPTLAKYFEDLYIREEKKLRHYVRTNPQKTQSIFPVRHPKPGRRGPGAPPRKKPGPGPSPGPGPGPGPGPDPEPTAPPTADSTMFTVDNGGLTADME